MRTAHYMFSLIAVMLADENNIMINNVLLLLYLRSVFLKLRELEKLFCNITVLK